MAEHWCRLIIERKPTTPRSRDGRYRVKCGACPWESESTLTIIDAEARGEWHQARMRNREDSGTQPEPSERNEAMRRAGERHHRGNGHGRTAADGDVGGHLQ